MMTDLNPGDAVFLECTTCLLEFAIVYEPRNIGQWIQTAKVRFCPACGRNTVLFEVPKLDGVTLMPNVEAKERGINQSA